ncbi:MAG TPA: lysozyme inhibitor LprI family protein [Burkholderiales bacterium]
MKRIVLLVAAIAIALPATAPAALDCSRAKSNAEKLLCSNPRLAQADERLAFAFRAAVRRGADPEQLMESQRAWVRDARDVCNDAECMLRAYEERISDLDAR